MAGPALNFFDAADDPKAAPELILDELNLTETVVVPHMDNVKFISVISSINQKLLDAGYQTAPLTDAQALVVNGDKQKII